MKRLGIIIALALSAVYFFAHVVFEFMCGENSEQPHRMYLAAAIGIIVGLATLLFYRLTPRLRRGAKLVTLGAAAGFAALTCIYVIYWAMEFSFSEGYSDTLAILAIETMMYFLLFEFYQVFRKRVL